MGYFGVSAGNETSQKLRTLPHTAPLPLLLLGKLPPKVRLVRDGYS